MTDKKVGDMTRKELMAELDELNELISVIDEKELKHLLKRKYAISDELDLMEKDLPG